MTPSIDYDSPIALRSFLEERSLGMQKKFGQNFLINKGAREKLLDALGAEEGSSVWEIGPGLGAMTSGLLDRNLKVCAFEIDRGFASALRELFADRPHFRLIEGDVLKTWPLEAAQSLPPYLFGNLPYNIAATIIANLVEEGQIFNRIVVTVQKEVAKRMAAKPGTKDYSSFSVLCASAYTVSNLMTLKPGSFYPVPHVDSAAVLMQRRQDDLELPRLFRSLVRALFSSRRKTIKNNLDAFAASLSPGIDAQSLSIESIAAAGLKGTERAEVLGIPEFSSLARALEHTLETRRGQA